MLDKLKRNIILAIIFAFVIFFAFTFVSDFDSIVSSFNDFPLVLLPILLLLSSLNLFFRFLKWHYYVRSLGIAISFWESFLIFTSGLVMSVTPGKWGEFLKSFLIKHKTGIAVSKTIPIVISERITDVISLIIFAMVGAYIYNYGIAVIFSIGMLYFILMFLLLNRKISRKIIAVIKKVKLFAKYYQQVEHLDKNLYELFKPKTFLVTLFLSFTSWLFEFFGFYIILRSFTFNISMMLSSSIYSFATIIGSLSMLPGGLGVTEGSLTFLLVDNGFTNEYAIVATLIVRAVTLWYAEIIGALALLFFSKREIINFKNVKFSKENRS